MPLLKLETTVVMPEEKQKPLLSALSKAVAAGIGKPEQYVMVTANRAAIWMSGEEGAAAFVDTRSIGGLSSEVNQRLSKSVTQLIGDNLGIKPERVFLNFTDLKAGNWGWSGSTIG